MFARPIHKLKGKRVYADGGYFDGAIPKTSTYMTNFAMGGSLQAHGIKEGDTFIKTMSGAIQKVKDRNGNIVYINLANGERSSVPLMPFNKGGAVTNERLHVNKGEDYEVRYAKPRPARKGYKGLRSFEGGGDLFEDYQNQPEELAEIVNLYEEKINNGDYDYVDSKKFLKEVNAIGYTFDYGLDNVPYNLRPMGEKPSKFFGGGLFKKPNFTSSKKYPNLNQEQVYLKNGEFVAVLEQNDDELLVMEYSKMGSGERPKKINISEVDMTSFKYGGKLIGNQKRIDMNKNGKIDAEDFKLLRSSMNGAWRNERKHVNHNEDYEVRYAKKKPARTGYKGKRNFAEGGGVNKNIEVKNFADLKQGDVIRRKDKLGTSIFVVIKSPIQNRLYKNEYDAFVTCIVSNTDYYKSNEEYNITSIVKYGKLGNVDYIGKWNYNDKIDYSIYLPKSQKKLLTGGGISNFERLSKVVAKNYEGKRVKPQYQKEYGKVYSKSEAKEVGNKVAGKMKMMKKAESGAEVKKGNRGGIMLLAKKIRKEGESWRDAVKRAGQQLK